jgi:hypothetical protein
MCQYRVPGLRIRPSPLIASSLAGEERAERLLHERAEREAALGGRDPRAVEQVGWQLEGRHASTPLRGGPSDPPLVCHAR